MQTFYGLFPTISFASIQCSPRMCLHEECLLWSGISPQIQLLLLESNFCGCQAWKMGLLQKWKSSLKNRSCIHGTSSSRELCHVQLFSKNVKEEIFGDKTKAVSNNFATLGKIHYHTPTPPWDTGIWEGCQIYYQQKRNGLWHHTKDKMASHGNPELNVS